MRRFWRLACCAAWLLMVSAAPAPAESEADPAVLEELSPEVVEEKGQAAETKAEILEQKASPEGGQEPPAADEKIAGAEAQAVDPAGDKPLEDALTCLARTIYWEAKGEGREGMEAIANVVMNRLGHEGFPVTVCEVVTQGREQGTCQFSWWCDGRPDDVEEEEPYALAKEVARLALNRDVPDRTDGALYFHRTGLNPSWAGEYTKTMEVGEHLFYRPKDGAAM